jgi:hypothetical protein
MPLNEEQREKLEDVVMDLHYTSTKFVDTEKDVHKKMLQVNVEEALDLLKVIQDDIKDDPKIYDYKLHMLIPFQIYELICMREEQNDK